VLFRSLNLFGGGGTMSNAGTLYRARPGGPLKRWKEVEGASFLNGMAQLSPTELLIADSRGGVLWRLDGTTGQTTPFVRDPLLDTADPASLTPAANGIKLYAGSVYVSNTARGLLLRIPLDGRQPGAVEVLAEKLRADDFAFSPDGRLHYTTHRDKIFVFENGRSVEFAGAEAGVVGNTALLWGPDGSGPYVTTDGGYVAQQWYRGPEAGPAQLLKFHG
jgi:sugar lactone lactonase YvrE